MKRFVALTIAVALLSLPLVVSGQEPTTPKAERAARGATIEVTPSENSCSVSLVSENGGGFGETLLGETPLGGKQRTVLLSKITCTCGYGSKSVTQECPKGGRCVCSPPGDNPSVVCN
jgi:hypothetical protein